MTRLTTRTALPLLVIAGVVALSGCSTVNRFGKAQNEANPAPCPNVIVLQDAARMVNFSGPEALENVAFTGEITNVETTCRYYDDEPIRAEVTVDFAFGRGPMAQDGTLQANYFVAVTRTDKDVIAKEEFSLPVRFSRNSTVATLRDKVGNIVIPRKDGEVAGNNFEIVVGLALTREQVLYNRSGKSLKFPDLPAE